MAKPYGIVVSSQKGGVGKTTVAVNLATALRCQGYRVLLIDADYANPTVGFHLGMQEANIGIDSVASGKAKLESAVAIHNPTGLHVLPGKISSNASQLGSGQARFLFNMLLKSNYDFIVIDTAPGPMPIEAITQFKGVDNLEMMILLTPEMAACTSALRLANVYEKTRMLHSMVVNRVRNRRYELSIEEMEDVLGEGMLATLPEDENVPISVAEHIPVVLLKRRSDFSLAMATLSRRIASRIGAEAPERSESRRGGIIQFLKRLFHVG